MADAFSKEIECLLCQETYLPDAPIRLMAQPVCGRGRCA